MSSVFISYRQVSPDGSLAEALHQGLLAAGLDVFLDRDLVVGENWDEVIGGKLDEARYFVVLLSPDAVVSEMVGMEIVRAHAKIQIGHGHDTADPLFDTARGALQHRSQVATDPARDLESGGGLQCDRRTD